MSDVQTTWTRPKTWSAKPAWKREGSTWVLYLGCMRPYVLWSERHKQWLLNCEELGVYDESLLPESREDACADAVRVLEKAAGDLVVRIRGIR